MVKRVGFTTGGASRHLLWFLLWVLSLGVGVMPRMPDLPAYQADLSSYPWLYLREEKPPEQRNNVVELVAVGDVMLGRGVSQQEQVFASVTPWIAAADLAIGNFEGVLSEEGSARSEIESPNKPETVSAGSLPASSENPIYLFSPPGAVKKMQQAGFDVLGMANNHAMDGGTDQLNETAMRFRNAGISVIGVGPSQAAADQPEVLKIKGLRIACLAFTDQPPLEDLENASGWFVAEWQRERILPAVQLAHSRYDLVVVSVHWGQEYSPFADARQREIAQALTGAGADLVIGHHSHTVQGISFYGANALIDDNPERVQMAAFSLGNFIFDQFSAETRAGLALRVFFDHIGLLAVQALPVWTAPRVQLIPPEQAIILLARVAPVGQIVRFGCEREGCSPDLEIYDETRSIASDPAIPRTGQIDLTGDGQPEIVQREGVGIVIYQNGNLVWRSPPEWQVVDFALGDPNDDGRGEVLIALRKPGTSGQMQSHPFIVGYRGGMYRLMWGGTAVAQPISEVEIADVDGDGIQELIVLEDQENGLQTLGVWRWHGWGFSLVWRSKLAHLQGLHQIETSDRTILEVGVLP
jgi:poly-gamma-glutamate capsule biosynthesis protein CapA/YwtB (metallophosphatase superfamily)